VVGEMYGMGMEEGKKLRGGQEAARRARSCLGLTCTHLASDCDECERRRAEFVQQRAHLQSSAHNAAIVNVHVSMGCNVQ
jgi:hypothetical protein